MVPRMKPTHVEIEAKLILPKAERLKQLPQALRSVCCSTRKLGLALIRDTYYDTPHWRLHRAGVACRIRRTEGRAMLVLKSLRRPSGGVSVRAEYEQPLRTPIGGFLRRLTGPVGGKVKKFCGGEPLQALFVVRNRRRTFEVTCADGLVAQVCADDFTVTAGGNSRELAELELEVVRGDRRQLQRLARALSARLKLSPGSRAKFQQGLEVGGHRPHAAR